VTKIHALIIEDNADNIEVLQRLLANEGIASTQVLDTGRLDEVLHRVEQVDIVFLDLKMPKSSGYEVFEYLRNDVGLTVPVVAYTVYANQIGNARACGFDSFLGKPLDPQRFPDQLSKILNGEAVWDTP
jgi:two-component system cell cycle response regulator DivK